MGNLKRSTLPMILTCLCCAIGATVFAANTDDDNSYLHADEDALQIWQDRRFGMFIHWGPVSLKGTEIGWSRGAQIPQDEYDNLYKQFNPTKFDADAWARTAKAAGMKYVVITTKHHDGFCLWPSKYTDYDIGNTPFKRDVLKELSQACRRQGLAFGTYYSVCDWWHADFPLGSPGGRTKKPNPNLDRYTKYLKGQVTELIENYGPLSTMWFDVPQEFEPDRGKPIVKLVRSLQGDIIINNRTYNGRGEPVGDYDTPEQHIGGFNRKRPWETCMTICRQWAWKPNDDMKSLAQCLQTLIRVAGGDGNLLFNVGPMPDGRIEPRQVQRLREMGQWLEKYGQSIYGTRGGPFKPGHWGACTLKGNTLYVHIMNWSEDQMKLGPLPKRVVSCTLMTGGSVKVVQTDKATLITVPRAHRQEIDTIVKLELDGPAIEIPPIASMPSGSVAAGGKATASNVYQNMSAYGADKAFDDDPETRWATDYGITQASLEVDLGKPATINRAMIDERRYIRVKKFQLQFKRGDGWKTFFEGTTLGEKKKLNFAPITARYVRLNILGSADGPTIWEFQLFATEN